MRDHDQNDECGEQYPQRVHAQFNSHPDRRRCPKAGRGIEADRASRMTQDDPGAQESHPGDDVGGDAGRIAALDVCRDRRERARAESHRRVGADAGPAPADFSLDANQYTEKRRHQCAQGDAQFQLPIHLLLLLLLRGSWGTQIARGPILLRPFPARAGEEYKASRNQKHSDWENQNAPVEVIVVRRMNMPTL